nr:hypothetical protein [Streptococcus equi]
MDDALSMSRSLGVGYVLANQFSKQLPKQLRESIYANCHNQIIFGLSMNEAKELAGLVPEVSAEDFYKLPPFQVYAKVPIVKNTLKWLSAKPYQHHLPFAIKMRFMARASSDMVRHFLKNNQANQPQNQSMISAGRKGGVR